MIPKTIHYCWFGGNPLPDLAQKCIASWRKFLPDYEIREWNEDNYDVRKIPYTAQAYDAGKYAFVSDYARFDILHEYGGIYFDTDVEVIRPLDDILERGAFMGVERAGALAAGLGMASPAASRIFREVLDSYEASVFLRADGTMDLTTVVERVSSIFKRHGFTDRDEIQQVVGITVYPAEYFCPMNMFTHELHITENTAAIHHYSASWINEFDQKYADIRKKLIYRFGVKLGAFLARTWFFFANMRHIGVKTSFTRMGAYLRKALWKR
ncbi:MAG: glycosyl transferase [Treponema sp.]|nr:glycosyl transferase [Treponema sp.]